ncbi:hypothetical protein CKJ54_19840 [Mycobacterium marseillense]|uniref:Uncharacterized protein n=1 Tax=Mycobacterium marseillense TaxID=701042 RepID=A0AAC9YM62_9MYCO|nr:hypothetical protein CKJ54_19840 [Mycobacterium marseillense]
MTHWTSPWRPASPGSAALAIATRPHRGDPLHPAPPRSRSPLDLTVATRFTRLRRARDRHCPGGAFAGRRYSVPHGC